MVSKIHAKFSISKMWNALPRGELLSLDRIHRNKIENYRNLIKSR